MKVFSRSTIDKLMLMKQLSIYFIVLILLCGLNFFTTDTIYAATKPPTNAVKSKVIDVIDGDTVQLTYKGRKEIVRLISVDSPETKNPSKCVQLYGPEATAFTKKSLLQKEVKIELGQQTRDKQGRLQAYIYVNDILFNKTLIENGLARVSVIKPNVKYLSELQTAEKNVKAKKIGLWKSSAATKGACAPKKPTPAPKPAPTPPVSQYFKNCTELRTKYPNGVGKGHPAYQSKLDRDNDGWACER